MFFVSVHDARLLTNELNDLVSAQRVCRQAQSKCHLSHCVFPRDRDNISGGNSFSVLSESLLRCFWQVF